MNITKIVDTSDFRFIVVNEEDWQDEDGHGSFSMLPIYVVTCAELTAYANVQHKTVDTLMDVLSLGSASAIETLVSELEGQTLGKIEGEGRVFNPDPDSDIDGVKGPEGIHLLFATL